MPPCKARRGGVAAGAEAGFAQVAWASSFTKWNDQPAVAREFEGGVLIGM